MPGDKPGMTSFQTRLCSVAHKLKPASKADHPPTPSRLAEFQHEFVHRRRVLEHDVGARVLGMAQEIGGGDEGEAGGFDLRAQRRLADAMQGLADAGAVLGTRRVIGHHQDAAGLERVEQFLSMRARFTPRNVVS